MSTFKIEYDDKEIKKLFDTAIKHLGGDLSEPLQEIGVHVVRGQMD